MASVLMLIVTTKKDIGRILQNLFVCIIKKINTNKLETKTKWFGSADCDTIYLFLCTKTADPNPFRGTHCIYLSMCKQ